MRVQQRASTLKGFVRVSKRGDGPTGKAGVKPAGRITRSRAAELAAAPAVAAPAEPPAAVPSSDTAPGRKRKLAQALSSDAADTSGSPAKRATRAKRVQPAGRQQPVAATTRRESTIREYFAPAPAAGTDAAPEADGAATVVEAAPVSAAVVPEPVAEGIATVQEDEALPAGAEQAAERAARANVLLERLRGRKRPEAAGDCASTAAKAEETRAIQEAIRARREQPAADAIAGKAAACGPAASFDAAKTMTAEEARVRELKRQFVKISPPAGGAAPLPRELRKLDELFQGLEHAVMFDGQGASGVVYHRIRKGVEAMAKRTFGWRELGQILAVYPESYTYAPLQTSHEGRRVASVALTPVARGVSLAVDMEARRAEFRRRLVALVDSAHRGFLVARGYSEAEVGGTSGWHPAFDVEATPAVAPLPLPPTTVQEHQAAGVVARFDRDRLKHLLGSSQPAAPPSAGKDEPPAVLALPTPADSPLLRPAGGGGEGSAARRPTSSANALLERIRAKQRAKEMAAAEAAAVVPAATRSMHSRLPGILDAVSFLYYAERKSVLQFFYVVDKLVESKGLDRPDTARHLVALAGFVPEWCSISDATPDNPSPAALLRVSRAISLQQARAQLQAKIPAQG
ncbi:hypothetical protein H4R21_002896 [Coemansia helicoidea]|uniref:Uncharacterized protein n=2 Tax=Coemansia TaxID=4863 RepID=A0ACC1L5D8_9FUNG|nr:hypothetical protein H4R21_002896 [Coemansia helicoidea]